MKVLFVTFGLPPNSQGGVAVYSWNLAQAMSKIHQVNIFSRFSSLKPEYTVSDEERDGCQIRYIVKNDIFPKDFLQSFVDEKIELLFIEYLNQVQPEVVHFQHVLGLSVRLPQIASERGIPVIINLHDYWYLDSMPDFIPGQSIVGSEFDRYQAFQSHNLSAKILGNSWLENGLKKLTPLSVKIFLKKIILRFFYNKASLINRAGSLDRTSYMRQALSSAKVLLAPSKTLIKHYQDYGFDYDYRLMPWGVESLDKKIFRPQNSQMVFGYLGAISQIKGVDILVKAFSKLSQKDCQLVLVGSAADERYYQELKKITKGLNVKMISHQDNVNSWYDKFSVVIVSSVCEETYNLVVREALLRQIPVIITDAGAMKEVVENEINGLVVPAGSVEKLAQAMERLTSDPILYKKLSEAKTLIPTIEDNVGACNQIYNELCPQK